MQARCADTPGLIFFPRSGAPGGGRRERSTIDLKLKRC
jgi:hypothetical protein